MSADPGLMIDDLRVLVEALASERLGKAGADDLLAQAGFDEEALFGAYRALVNTREPLPVADELLVVQDRVLRARIERVGVTDAGSLPRCAIDERLSLWRGDITALKVDAIVNAANSKMLGCWVPGHFCIDNCIHTYAGIQLRLACDDLMRDQGFPEPTGEAKVTDAFNLPARYVVHTVGPIVQMGLTDDDRRLLGSCYTSCLQAATDAGCKSIAFCCISTGVFGFPADEAAEIAVRTVCGWLDWHADEGVEHVVFDVFTDNDERLYRELLS